MFWPWLMEDVAELVGNTEYAYGSQGFKYRHVWEVDGCQFELDPIFVEHGSNTVYLSTDSVRVSFPMQYLKWIQELGDEGQEFICRLIEGEHIVEWRNPGLAL